MAYRQVRSSNKYNAKGRHYNGQWYDSTGEMNYAQELDWRLKAGEIKSWERQVKLELKVNGVAICNYYVDFLIHHNDGSREYVEYKGFETEVWRLKLKILMATQGEIMPGATFTVVKHRSTYRPK